MKLMHVVVVIAAVVAIVMTTGIEARKKKHKSSSKSTSPGPLKTKTKTKWSSSTDVEPNGVNSMIATEEHGYYVKRTFLPMSNASGVDGAELSSLRSPPYLAIPIAWFSCADNAAECSKGNSALINGAHVPDGFLCDDDCMEPYNPVCGKTHAEIAVFYNKCKLNVAKCRTHGMWTDVAYEECRKQYPNEVEYATKKFKSSPFFMDGTAGSVAPSPPSLAPTKEDNILEDALVALGEINDRLSESMHIGQSDEGADDEEMNVTIKSPSKTTKAVVNEVPKNATANQNEINKMSES